MTCRHCGKEISDEFGYCPYCAEPKVDKEPQKRKYYHWGEAFAKIVLFAAFYFIICFLYALFHNAINATNNGIKDIDVLATCLLLYIPGLIIDIVIIVKRYKNPKTRIINGQFYEDQTSICTKCGSHNIKIYRNGYDYSTGYWFRRHGGAYIAGMNSNNARCRCMRCGNDWLTDYDYRLIK